jgi:hypothetical protein
MSAFRFDGAGLKAFCKELEKLPKMIQQAQAMTLNNAAFKFRDEAANAIISEFTNRRPDFVRRQFRVTKATAANMEAVAGSVGVANNPAFTGFLEMLPGEGDDRRRFPTLFARGDNASNIVPKKNRMNAGEQFPVVDSSEYGIPAALSMLYRAGAKGFIIRGEGLGFAPGLYQFTAPTNTGRDATAREKLPVKLVQKIGKPKKAPRKLDWITIALSKITDAFMTEQNIKNLDYLVKKKVFK